MGQHFYRWMVDSDSPTITDEELNELSDIIPLGEYCDNDLYEYNGNHIITKDVVQRDEAMKHMCCGITYHDIKLLNGEMIYFAFDYGH